jgi:hypothetical protein
MEAVLVVIVYKLIKLLESPAPSTQHLLLIKFQSFEFWQQSDQEINILAKIAAPILNRTHLEDISKFVFCSYELLDFKKFLGFSLLCL